MCVFYWQSNTSFIFLFTSKNQNKWQNFYFLHLAVTFKSQAQLKMKRTSKITVNIYLFYRFLLILSSKRQPNLTVSLTVIQSSGMWQKQPSHPTHPTQAGENCSVFCLMKCSIITLLYVSMCQTATNTNTSIFFQILSPPPSLVLHPFTFPTPTPLPLSYIPSPAPFIFLRQGFTFTVKIPIFFVNWGISFAIVLMK